MPPGETATAGGGEGWAAVVVHGAAEAEAALRAAREAGAGVVLLSARHAGAFPGPRVVAAFLDRAASRVPGAPHARVLDCGAAPGHALHAIRGGWRAVVLDPSVAAYGAVASAAAEAGARVLPARPEALDLSRVDLRREGGRRLLGAWLLTGARARPGAG